MIGAYVMISVLPGRIRGVVKELKKTPQVGSIAVITGEYDIVVRVSVENLGLLADVTDSVSQIDGIAKTHTHVIERELSV